MLWRFLLEAASGSGEGGTGTEATKPTGCTTEQWIMYGVLFAILIAFFVWTTISSRKRQKQEMEKRSQLKVGDRATTIGGICGFVVDINDEENTFTLETGYGENKSYVKFDKGALHQSAPISDETPAEVPAEPFEDKKEEAVTEEVKTEEVKPEEPAAPVEEKKEEKPKKKKAKEEKDPFDNKTV